MTFSHTHSVYKGFLLYTYYFSYNGKGKFQGKLPRPRSTGAQKSCPMKQYQPEFQFNTFAYHPHDFSKFHFLQEYPTLRANYITLIYKGCHSVSIQLSTCQILSQEKPLFIAFLCIPCFSVHSKCPLACCQRISLDHEKHLLPEGACHVHTLHPGI